MDSSSIVLIKLRDMHDANCTVALILFLSYIALTGFALLNLLIGILCDIMTNLSSKEQDKAALKMMKMTILQELKAHDPHGTGFIGSHELTQVLESTESSRTL